ncbi:response regulator [Dinghuibacter silviterrae]|uniref:LytTR family two component transcriptional regulator n=1 Tax=Dinghuibacter silviterrae TaxID=1539049 RepID=A0A4R8DGD4_9BACT|nr:response regulator [Dinghuibacter silviterrae]TDW96166.1 LytTR family two component transcriptional regulator [Dinghuibacter silviterrae]
MEPTRVMIIEDEALVAMDLAKGLEKDGYQVTGIADNAREAVELFRAGAVDILLVDVNIIGDKDGIDTATELLKHRSVPLIYLTAFTDPRTLERAKATQPSAYLAKPYTLTNVRIAIEMAMHNFAVTRQGSATGKVISLEKHSPAEASDKETILRLDDYIFVKHQYTFVRIRLADIHYVEAENNYVQLVTAERKFLLRLSFAQLLEKIDYKPLVRIHRSYAVNIDVLHAFNEQEVTVGKTVLPIGRTYREEFLKRFHFR